MPGASTILIAEDDPQDAFLLERAFLNAGLSVRMQFVVDGEEAISYLKGTDEFADRRRFPFPDLLLLDLKMPRLDGFDVLQWVRRQPGLKRLLIAVLTSSDQPEDVNRAYDLGANSYLVKPSAAGSLLDMVARTHDYWLGINHCPDCHCPAEPPAHQAAEC